MDNVVRQQNDSIQALTQIAEELLTSEACTDRFDDALSRKGKSIEVSQFNVFKIHLFASAFGRFVLYSRFVTPFVGIVRPALEGTIKAHGLSSNRARELSYMDLSLRPGIILGRDFPRVFLAYRGNLLLINLDDKKVFYEAHRGELELETSFGLVVFAGAGRRFFRENGRTRTEIDGGAGLSLKLCEHFRLLSALSGNYYFAVGQPYDQVSGMALLAARFDFKTGVYAGLGVTSGLDYYPNSGGQIGKLAFGTSQKRFYFLLKQYEELWSPLLLRFRIGLRYEFSYRNSTADTVGSNYDYREHRILVAVRAMFDTNPWAPRAVKSDSHIELDYGIENGGHSSFSEEKIQDLLRQDEAARASSSCVE